MKKTFFLLFALSSIILTSCSITENLIINENGSGRFSYDVDASQLIGMVGKSEFSKNENKTKKVIDSIISYKDILATKKDSISKLSKEEQEKLKQMERFSMRMIIDEEKEIMKYSMFTEFQSVQELQEMMSPLQGMSAIGGAQNKMMDGVTGQNSQNNSSQSFIYDGKSFKKIIKTNKNVENDVALEKSENENEEKQMEESLKMMYAQSSFKMKYQFPKAVKSISLENTFFSDDRKTIVVEFPINKYLENPEELNFEVIFE